MTALWASNSTLFIGKPKQVCFACATGYQSSLWTLLACMFRCYSATNFVRFVRADGGAVHRGRSRSCRLTIVPVLAILFWLDNCPAQNQPSREVRAVKVEQAPKIDGVVDDAVWESA